MFSTELFGGCETTAAFGDILLPAAGSFDFLGTAAHLVFLAGPDSATLVAEEDCEFL